MEELLSTEREYVKALGYVREHYFPELERVDVPQDLRGQRGIVFGNLEKLHDFHQHHFLSELESLEDEPLRVGRCFLRHVGHVHFITLNAAVGPKRVNSLLVFARSVTDSRADLCGQMLLLFFRTPEEQQVHSVCKH